MQWNPKSRMKKGVTHVSCLWILMMFLACFVTSCGYSRGDPSANMPSPTVIPHKKASPFASSPTPAVQPAAPHILPGDWPSFLLGSGGYNSYEKAITPSTASSLTRSWVAHAGGGISSEPVVVDGTIYWGSWDGYEHATSVDGRARWSTFLGKVSNPQCYPPTAGVASTATVMPIMIKGVQTLVDFVGGGDAHMYALNATTGKILWATSLGSSPGTFIWGSPVVYQDDIYIGTASVAECPGTAGRFFKLDVATGSIEHDLDLVPEGCLGVGIWSSPTLDPDSGELYLTTSNASICPETERYAMSMIELHADTLSIVGSWQVPAAEAVADGDFGATPTLFTARLEGVSRALVGAVNKNGIFYAFRRGEISAGPVWRARISSSAYRVMAPPILVPGLVVASAGPSFFVLDATQGTIVFGYQDITKDSTFDGAATIAHGLLSIGNLDGTLFAFTLAHEGF